MRSVVRVARYFVLVSLATASAVRAQDTIPAGVATLIGTVTDSGGGPLSGAEVTLLGSSSVRALTSDSGTFRLAGLPTGSVVLSVRRLGYEPATFTAQLRAGRVHRAHLVLSATAQALPTVAVSDTAQKTHWLDAFDARRTTQRGTFMTRAEIEHKMARNGSDLLRTVPGVRVSPGQNGSNDVQMTRASGTGRCSPQLFVHGMPYGGTMDDFAVEDIEALEVYVGVSEVPAELSRSMPSAIGRRGGMTTPCAAVVVWTRDPRKRP